jgi:membrane-bound serine protease (ClpP class)
MIVSACDPLEFRRDLIRERRKGKALDAHGQVRETGPGKLGRVATSRERPSFTGVILPMMSVSLRFRKGYAAAKVLLMQRALIPSGSPECRDRGRFSPRAVIAALCLVVGLVAAVAQEATDELLREVEQRAEQAQAAETQPPTPLTISRALVVNIEGGIGPAVTMYVEEGLDAARAAGDAMLVLRMNTPGGLDSSTRDIIRTILASNVPVATYVAPSGARAASAGTYILYASHVAAMAPSTNLGAATPVQMGGIGGGGEDEGENAMTRKVVNDAVAFIRGLAELRDRNADWAEAAVREAASLTSSAAVEQNVADFIATDMRGVIDGANGLVVSLPQGRVSLETTGAAIVDFEPRFMTRVLNVITNPNIAYILMLIGIYGLIFEFANPGIIFSGVIGAICLVLGLFALNLLPINYAAFALVGIGIALMIAEAFSPSFGILGIGGAIAFALGSLMIFDGDIPGFELSIYVVLASTAVTALIVIVAVASAIRSFRSPAATGDTALMGEAGRVISWSGNAGEIEIHGERWHAVSDAPLATGQLVRVIVRDGLKLRVQALPDRDGGLAARMN